MSVTHWRADTFTPGTEAIVPAFLTTVSDTIAVGLLACFSNSNLLLEITITGQQLADRIGECSHKEGLNKMTYSFGAIFASLFHQD